jgi:hypothetical protein
MPMIPRLYRMTIATHWYDQPAKRARSFEAHFKIARYGQSTTVRKNLADKGLADFQREIRRRYGVNVLRGKMRVSFEREESARRIDQEAQVEFRGMEFRGKQYGAISAPSKLMRYVKRRRKRVRR